MHIQSIQNDTNFKSKPKYLSPKLRKRIIDLKQKMEDETVILKTRVSDQIIRVRSLSIQDEAVFKNGKYLAKRDKQNKLIPYGKDTSMIEFGKVRMIVKDSGEIIEYKKPFFKSWDKILKQASDYINHALDYYYDFEKVKRITQKKEEFTPEGIIQLENEYSKIMNIFNKLNPWSK